MSHNIKRYLDPQSKHKTKTSRLRRETTTEIVVPCGTGDIYFFLVLVSPVANPNQPNEIMPAPFCELNKNSEVEVGVPDAAGRTEILRVLLRGVPHEMDEGEGNNQQSLSGDGCPRSSEQRGGLEDIAGRTHGFVGADLQLLVKEAALQALRRSRGSSLGGDHSKPCSGDGGDGNYVGRVVVGGGSAERRRGLPRLTPTDFIAALPLVSPSGLREVAVEVPKVKWGDIGGMESVKQSLREVVEWPLRHPEAFQRMGMSPPRGVLLYGPPGCSKTLMARALATESGMNFLAVKGEEIIHFYMCTFTIYTALLEKSTTAIDQPTKAISLDNVTVTLQALF